jgi:hypothetical protein
LIGSSLRKGKPKWKDFERIKKGDKIIYYVTGDKGILGIFEVTSNMSYLEDDEYWQDDAIYKIRPLIMPTEGHYVDFKSLLSNSGVKFDLFPDKKKWPFKIWHHYIYPITDHDYQAIANAIKSKRYEVGLPKAGTISERLGAAFKTIDLLFEPIDEMGVVYLFAKYHAEIGFPYIIRLRQKFPDVIAIDDKGERVHLELEYRASNFAQHGHDPKQCQYCVCWENDWEYHPKQLTIISLKERLRDIFSKGYA